MGARVFLRENLRLLLCAAAALLLPGLGLLTLALLGAEHLEGMRQSVSMWYLPMLLAAAFLAGWAMLPTHAVSLMGGFFFGIVAGTVWAITAIAGGSVIGHATTRLLARSELSLLLDRHPKIRGPFDRLYSGKRQILAMTLTRLPPQIPFALGNVLAASSGISWFTLACGTALGMLPRVFLVVWIGSGLSEWNLRGAVPDQLVWALVAAVVGFGGLLLLGWWMSRSGRPETNPAAPDSPCP